MKIDGCINLTFTIGGTEMQQLFYVVSDMNRNLSLGTDFLRQVGVRIFYDLGCLRIANKTYVNMEEDIYISSVARIKNTTLLKLHLATICYGKLRQNPDIPVKTDYQVSAVCKGSFIENRVYKL